MFQLHILQDISGHMKQNADEFFVSGGIRFLI